jgi:hypothetical protein
MTDGKIGYRVVRIYLLMIILIVWGRYWQFNSIGIPARDDGSGSTSREFRDLAILRDFISEYKQLSELWNVRCKEYSNRDKKNSAYKKLLVYYKLLKNNSTIIVELLFLLIIYSIIEDVKKKLIH